MKTGTKVVGGLLVLAVVLLGGYALFQSTKPLPPPPPPQTAVAPQPTETRTPVVVADKLLPAGMPIDAATLKVVDLPIDPAGAYRETSALAGKIPKFDIGPGAPVLEGSLMQGLPSLLNEGERAVAVAVDDAAGAGHLVSPGDFVDVFFTLKDGQPAGKSQARLLLSRLRVLTYGSEPRAATLAVPIGDVNRLLLASQNGKLQLVLRNPNDTATADPTLFPELPSVLAGKPTLTDEQREALKQADNEAYAGLELGGLDGTAAKPAAVPVPAEAVKPVRRPVVRPAPRAVPNTVEVVRGTKREVVGF
jgi:pilus assembly protein CpaB